MPMLDTAAMWLSLSLYLYVYDFLVQANDDPYNLWTRFVCDSVMGPTVFKTAKMRRFELGGGMMLTEVKPGSGF